MKHVISFSRHTLLAVYNIVYRVARMHFHRASMLIVLLSLASLASADRVVPMRDGSFENWTVRQVHESRLLGGHTRFLYEIGGNDTIRENSYLLHTKGCPWRTSNAFVRVAGVEKASCSVRPEARGKSTCCRLDCAMDTITAAGLPLKVLVAGSIFTGEMLEPIGLEGGNNPMSVMNMGIPYTGHPTALQLDYRTFIEQSNSLVFANAGASVRSLEGRDGAQITIILQHRTEDKNGHIHAVRVATGCIRFMATTPWTNSFRIPILWGDDQASVIAKYPSVALNAAGYMAKNSRGKMVTILEEDEDAADLEPTHMIILISSGCHQAFTGHPGNTLWVDNIALVY